MATIVQIGFPYHIWTPISGTENARSPPDRAFAHHRTPGHPPGRAFAFTAPRKLPAGQAGRL
jgi:hypothetical protein